MINLKGPHTCKLCGHTWKPIITWRLPLCCPGCFSYEWYFAPKPKPKKKKEEKPKRQWWSINRRKKKEDSKKRSKRAKKQKPWIFAYEKKPWEHTAHFGETKTKTRLLNLSKKRSRARVQDRARKEELCSKLREILNKEQP